MPPSSFFPFVFVSPLAGKYHPSPMDNDNRKFDQNEFDQNARKIINKVTTITSKNRVKASNSNHNMIGEVLIKFGGVILLKISIETWKIN